MRFINLVDGIGQVNFGIWNAAIATAAELQNEHGIASEIWFPDSDMDCRLMNFNGAKPNPLPTTSKSTFEEVSKTLNPAEDIIITHGAWRFPTKWGSWFKAKGFRWIYVPHGMLEPWSMRQKRLKKKIYFLLFEKPMALKADVVRAVGGPEASNLKALFKNVVHIANGVPAIAQKQFEKSSNEIKCLFMARLHYKKGILPLVEAWIDSNLANQRHISLHIAGTDDGELKALIEVLGKHKPTNIHYLGPVFGDAKKQLLASSHYYFLPSQSEGFPTSVIEAMQYGLVPVISKGCNFPEAFEHQAALEIEPVKQSIQHFLNLLPSQSAKWMQQIAPKAMQLASDNYGYSVLARQQASLAKALV